MALVDINWNPSKKELKVFLLLLVIFSFVVAAVSYHRGASSQVAAIILAVGLSISMVGFFLPKLARYIFIGWIVAVYPIGFVVSHLVMGIVYYLVVTPFGLGMRMLGHDPMQRKFDETAETYWQKRRDHTEIGRYFRQF